MLVTEYNKADYPDNRVGDTINIRIPPYQVDFRPFAQLAEMLGVPYPDSDE
jgi:hypothetical protein